MMTQNDEIVINPVWSRFCTVQIDSWADWLASIHVNSYLETAERFIGLNPFWVPTNEDRTPLFDNLMINDEFLESLSDAGLLVWANSTFRDFVTALRPYGRAVKEIDYVVSFFDTHIAWFSRVYQFIRAEAIMDLRSNGRKI
jgi:hypothetical protein